MNASARRLRIFAFALVGLVAAYGIVGGLIAPPLARKLIAEKLGERLGRVVAVDEVSINPYTLRATLRGFRILEADGKATFASFDGLDVNASAVSIYRLAPVIDELSLTALKVNVIRDSESHYNLSDILKRLTPAARAARKDERNEEPARFSVRNIRIIDAAIDFDDRPRGAKQRVSEVQVAIPFISNLPTHLKDQVQPSFSANINGTPVKLSGEALPFENTIRTHFDIDVRALDLPRYLGYLPAGLPVNVESGTLDARISLRFTQAPGKEPAVDLAGRAALHDVSLTSADGPLARFTRLEADIASLDPLGGLVKVASVRLAGASAMQGEWKVPSIEARDIGVDLKKHAVRVALVTAGDGALTVKRNHDGSIELPHLPPSEKPTKWDVALAKLAISGYTLIVVDGAVKPAATHRIVLASLEAEGLSTDNGFKGSATAKLRLDKGGMLDASSTFALDPLAVKATVDARSIDLVPLRAYVSQFSTVALKSGAASAKGTLSLQGQGEAIRIAYAGSAEIANLATLDTINREDLLNWKSVRAGGIRLGYAANAPLELAVAEVVVDKAYSRIVVTPEGKLNVQQLRTATPTQPDPPPIASPKPRNVRIDRVTFVDSRLNFTDHFIKPNYTADVGELQGSVTNLSSEPASRAAVDLKGRWDAASPVIIAGTVNPLRGDLFLDIAAKGQEIELTKLTAYSQRYAGYGITGGRLTLDVKYHIEDGKMEGRNKILVDQLTFGDKVESPEATKLPVLFALNLLKDSKGRIDLELPIAGSLEDPKFELGALIGQVVSNLFKRAVTSPFSLLAAAAGAGGGKDGGSEDLAFVEFDPGLAELTPAGEKKLETLVTLLQDRPGLKLEIASRLDGVKDVEALQAAARERKLAAAPKDLPKEAREKLMQEPIEVGEGELQALSARRSDVVKAYLVASARLPAERVLVASGPADAQDGSKARLSRVDLALK